MIQKSQFTWTYQVLWAISSQPQKSTRSTPRPRIVDARGELKGVDDLLIQARDDRELGLVFSVFLRFLEYVWRKVFCEDRRGRWFRIKRILPQPA